MCFSHFLQTWKTLEATEKSLNEKINTNDYDVSSFFVDENQPPKSPHEFAKRRGDRLELEQFYLGVSIHVFFFFQKIRKCPRLAKISIIKKYLEIALSTKRTIGILK